MRAEINILSQPLLSSHFAELLFKITRRSMPLLFIYIYDLIES